MTTTNGSITAQSVLTITSQPAPIPFPNNQGITVTNSGSSNVQLSTDAIPTASNSTLLVPQATTPLSHGPMWASTTGSEIGQLTILDKEYNVINPIVIPTPPPLDQLGSATGATINANVAIGTFKALKPYQTIIVTAGIWSTNTQLIAFADNSTQNIMFPQQEDNLSSPATVTFFLPMACSEGDLITVFLNPNPSPQSPINWTVWGSLNPFTTQVINPPNDPIQVTNALVLGGFISPLVVTSMSGQPLSALQLGGKLTSQPTLASAGSTSALGAPPAGTVWVLHQVTIILGTGASIGNLQFGGFIFAQVESTSVAFTIELNGQIVLTGLNFATLGGGGTAYLTYDNVATPVFV